MSPLLLFRRVAIAEAVTWALLLTGMFLKYVTDTTELGVRIFGMVHGVVFIAYCLTTVVVAVDQRWSRGRLLLGLAAVGAAVRDGARSTGTPSGAARSPRPGGSWPRLRRARSSGSVAWLLRHPVRGAAAGVVGVAALTGVALLVGPPPADRDVGRAVETTSRAAGQRVPAQVRAGAPATTPVAVTPTRRW